MEAKVACTGFPESLPSRPAKLLQDGNLMYLQLWLATLSTVSVLKNWGNNNEMVPYPNS